MSWLQAVDVPSSCIDQMVLVYVQANSNFSLLLFANKAFHKLIESLQRNLITVDVFLDSCSSCLEQNHTFTAFIYFFIARSLSFQQISITRSLVCVFLSDCCAVAKRFAPPPLCLFLVCRSSEPLKLFPPFQRTKHHLSSHDHQTGQTDPWIFSPPSGMCSFTTVYH